MLEPVGCMLQHVNPLPSHPVGQNPTGAIRPLAITVEGCGPCAQSAMRIPLIGWSGQVYCMRLGQAYFAALAFATITMHLPGPPDALASWRGHVPAVHLESG